MYSRRRMLGSLCAIAALSAGSAGAGQTAAGKWKVIDDQSGQPTAVIEITEREGLLEGRIARLIPGPGEDPDPRCTRCPGERKGQRIAGMTILWGLARQGDEYAGGEILDPDDGAVYRCRIRPSADGERLEVRGYLGATLFGRSQTWIRER